MLDVHHPKTPGGVVTRAVERGEHGRAEYRVVTTLQLSPTAAAAHNSSAVCGGRCCWLARAKVTLWLGAAAAAHQLWRAHNRYHTITP